MNRLFPLSIILILFAIRFTCVGAASAQEKGLLFAHRGGAHEFEENTLDAFKRSYDAGLRGFETDVRITRDGELVLLHDDTLDRTHDASGPIEEKTSAELRAIKTKKGDHPVVFLDDLLEFFADKPGTYLELEMKTRNRDLYPDEKVGEYCRLLYRAARDRQPEGSFYVFTSFDERPLKAIKQIDPGADLLYINDGPCTPEFVERAKELGVGRIGIRMAQTSREEVAAAQQAGLRVSGWPGHNLRDYFLAVGLGLDAICSDVPVAIQKWKDENDVP